MPYFLQFFSNNLHNLSQINPNKHKSWHFYAKTQEISSKTQWKSPKTQGFLPKTQPTGTFGPSRVPKWCLKKAWPIPILDRGSKKKWQITLIDCCHSGRVPETSASPGMNRAHPGSRPGWADGPPAFWGGHLGENGRASRRCAARDHFETEGLAQWPSWGQSRRNCWSPFGQLQWWCVLTRFFVLFEVTKIERARQFFSCLSHFKTIVNSLPWFYDWGLLNDHLEIFPPVIKLTWQKNAQNAKVQKKKFAKSNFLCFAFLQTES